MTKTCDHCGTQAKRRYAVRITKRGHTKVAMVGSSCAKHFPRANQSDLIRSLGNKTEEKTFFHGSVYEHKIGTILRRDEPVLGSVIRQREHETTFVGRAFMHPTENGLDRAKAIFFTDTKDCLYGFQLGCFSNYVYEVLPLGRFKRVDHNWFQAAMRLNDLFAYQEPIPEMFPIRTLHGYVDGYYSGKPYPGPILRDMRGGSGSDEKCKWEYIGDAIKIVRLVERPEERPLP